MIHGTSQPRPFLASPGGRATMGMLVIRMHATPPETRPLAT